MAPSDTQQTDTYYIVAHFHYVLFGGAVFGLFAGFYYWWPKIFGKMLNETLGKWNFWLMIIGMNLTFGPMHIIGLQGQPRRMYVWTENRAGEGFFNLGFWNLVATIGSFILAIGVLLFSSTSGSRRKKRRRRPLDPWDARSLEWMTTSPPKEHNFDAIPTVHALDEFFHRKYEDVGDDGQHDYKQGRAPARRSSPSEEANADAHIHMPSPSYWPIVLAFGLPIIAYGVIYSTLLLAVGGAHRRAWRCSAGRSSRPTADDSRLRPAVADGGQPSKELAAMADTTVEPSATPSPTASMPRRLRRRPGPHRPRPPHLHRAVATTSWRCGCSSARSACCSAA